MMEQKPRKLSDQVRDALRLKHYSIRTENAYVDCVRRSIQFYHKCYPADIGATGIEAFHTRLVGHLLCSAPFVELRPARAGDRPPGIGSRAALTMAAGALARPPDRALPAPHEGRGVPVPGCRHGFYSSSQKH